MATGTTAPIGGRLKPRRLEPGCRVGCLTQIAAISLRGHSTRAYGHVLVRMDHLIAGGILRALAGRAGPPAIATSLTRRTP